MSSHKHIHEQDVPRADQEAYAYTPSQAATTRYSDSTAEMDAKSRYTTYTYSSDTQRLVKKVDNRAWNVLNEGYILPTDDEEWARLDKQHIALAIAMQSLYIEKETVRAVLSPELGKTKRILDLGCGTGVWANEMAFEFPHAHLIGVDVAPTPFDEETLPSNCRFEIDDINAGLLHFRDQFDLVHTRFVGSGIHNFRKTMTDVHSCLKPGGVALWIDVDYDGYGKDFEYLLPASEDHPSGSWMQRIFYEIRRLAAQSGKSDMSGMGEALDAGLWEDPLIDPETCRTASLYLPIGPWKEGDTVEETQRLKYIGALMRQDGMNAQRTVMINLKKAGWSQDTLDKWADKADEELMNGLPMWGRMRLAWGRRRTGPGLPAPPLPLTSTESKEEEETSMPYPYFYIHHSREEAIKEAELRDRDKIFPSPLS